jgi:hypothetical protein
MSWDDERFKVHHSGALNGRDAFDVPFREFEIARLWVEDQKLPPEFWDDLEGVKIIAARRKEELKMFLCRTGSWDGT